MPNDPELPGMPSAKVPQVGSPAWTVAEWKRFRRLSKEHDGLTSPAMAAVAIGISRQRVHQIIQEGHLRTFTILGKPFLSCDEVHAFGKLDRDEAFRYAA